MYPDINVSIDRWWEMGDKMKGCPSFKKWGCADLMYYPLWSNVILNISPASFSVDTQVFAWGGNWLLWPLRPWHTCLLTVDAIHQSKTSQRGNGRGCAETTAQTHTVNSIRKIPITHTGGVKSAMSTKTKCLWFVKSTQGLWAFIS